MTKTLALAAIIAVASCVGGRVHEQAPYAAVASADPRATEAGTKTLKAGGNAFDAAIAVTAALAVVEPFNSGLGGGGFYLLHRAADARESAPAAATAKMYLDASGRVISNKSTDGPLAAAIPGRPLRSNTSLTIMDGCRSLFPSPRRSSLLVRVLK